MENMNEAFDLVPAIKVIVKCNSISALKSLKKLIDGQINEINDKSKGA